VTFNSGRPSGTCASGRDVPRPSLPAAGHSQFPAQSAAIRAPGKPTQSVAAETERAKSAGEIAVRLLRARRREQQARAGKRGAQAATAGTGARAWCGCRGQWEFWRCRWPRGFQWRNSGGSATTGAGGRGGSVTTSSPTGGASGGTGAAAAQREPAPRDWADLRRWARRAAALSRQTRTPALPRADRIAPVGATANASATPECGNVNRRTLASTDAGTGGATGSSATSAATGRTRHQRRRRDQRNSGHTRRGSRTTYPREVSSGCKLCTQWPVHLSATSAWLLFRLAALYCRNPHSRQPATFR